ncbi:MAG: Protease synthase and sporulation protein 2 [Bacteroidota bacterium]|jgi:transcriptional regulator
MYTPEIYQNHNQQEIESFLKSNAFGILINQTNNKIWGTHIPLELENMSNGKQILVGHIALENPQSKHLLNNDEVLCIFNGPHTYISSSWYDHENVPTWNYIAVHVYGKVRLHNLQETINDLEKLVDKYELNQQNPVKVVDFSKRTMLQARAILGFEIEITEIQATKKMSQNRDQKNYDNIIYELEKNNKVDSSQVATEMNKCPRN